MDTTIAMWTVVARMVSVYVTLALAVAACAYKPERDRWLPSGIAAFADIVCAHSLKPRGAFSIGCEPFTAARLRDAARDRGMRLVSRLRRSC